MCSGPVVEDKNETYCSDCGSVPTLPAHGPVVAMVPPVDNCVDNPEAYAAAIRVVEAADALERFLRQNSYHGVGHPSEWPIAIGADDTVREDLDRLFGGLFVALLPFRQKSVSPPS